MGVEAQAAQRAGGRAVVPVSRHGAAQLAQVGADLVLAPGVDVHLQQGVLPPRLDGAVVGHRLLAAGADGVDLVGGVLPQKGADGVLLPGGPALHHRQIAPAAHQRVPVLLIGPLGLLVFGEQEHAGGVAVQPVDDEHPPSGPGAAHVLPRHAVGGAHLLPVAGHAQQAGGLVNDQDAPVLIEHREGGPPRLRPLGEHAHPLAGGEGVVVAADGRPIHLHLPPGEQRLDMVAAPLHVLQQEGQQRAAPLHGKLHLFHTITS